MQDPRSVAGQLPWANIGLLQFEPPFKVVQIQLAQLGLQWLNLGQGGKCFLALGWCRSSPKCVLDTPAFLFECKLGLHCTHTEHER